MEKVFQWVNEKYKWLVAKVPGVVLHFIICFCAALISWELALGLALGKEANSLNSAGSFKGSLRSLYADTLGILLAIAIKFIF